MTFEPELPELLWQKLCPLCLTPAAHHVTDLVFTTAAEALATRVFQPCGCTVQARWRHSVPDPADPLSRDQDRGEADGGERAGP